MKNKIYDIVVSDLKVFSDERGKVMQMLRADSTLFKNFGEIYFSKVYENSIKAWKQHKEMTLNLSVPIGEIKLVLWDNRHESPTRGKVDEFILSEINYKLLTVPPKIWIGFKGIAKGTSMLANLASLPHSDEEVNHLDQNCNEVPYRW